MIFGTNCMIDGVSTMYLTCSMSVYTVSMKIFRPVLPSIAREVSWSNRDSEWGVIKKMTMIETSDQGYGEHQKLYYRDPVQEEDSQVSNINYLNMNDAA